MAKRNGETVHRSTGGYPLWRGARAAACAVLFGLSVISPIAQSADPRPTALDVTVIGANGRPVAGAEVTVAPVGAQSADGPAERAATTRSDGTASLIVDTDVSTRAPGVYRIDVSVHRAQSTTFVNPTAGATTAVKVDLGASISIDWGDQDYVAAAAAAADAAQASDQVTYKAAVANIEKNIEFRKQANKDFARAVEQYRRVHGIPADELDGVEDILSDVRAAENAGLEPEFPPGPVAQYRDLLELLEAWRNSVTGMEMVRDGIPTLE